MKFNSRCIGMMVIVPGYAKYYRTGLIGVPCVSGNLLEKKV